MLEAFTQYGSRNSKGSPVAREAAARAHAFCARYGLQTAGAARADGRCVPAGLSIAVANAGGMGAMGALVSPPEAIRRWVAEVRAASAGPLQLNTWMPDPPPRRDPSAEARVRSFMERWGPRRAAVGRRSAAGRTPGLQCEAFLEAGPRPCRRSWACCRRRT